MAANVSNNAVLSEVDKKKILLQAQQVREQARLMAQRLAIQTNTSSTATQIVYKVPLLVNAERLALLEPKTPASKQRKDRPKDEDSEYVPTKKSNTVVAKEKPPPRKAAKVIPSEPVMTNMDFAVPLSPELQHCHAILTELRNHKYARPFNQPVDTVSNPTYRNFVSRPMDLGTIMKKLCRGEYFSHDELKQDVHLVWYNCRCFNPEGHQLRQWADALEIFFDSKYEALLEQSAINRKHRQFEEKKKPLKEELTNLKMELAKLKSDPTLTASKAKVQEVASDEPLGYGDIRRLTQMVQDLAEDRDTIAKVVNIIHKCCPKAVQMTKDDVELDLGLLEPRTARELEQLCERALFRLKRKRSIASSQSSQSKRQKSSTDETRTSSPTPSEKSQKSTTSSFCRENLSGPPSERSPPHPLPPVIKPTITSSLPRPPTATKPSVTIPVINPNTTVGGGFPNALPMSTSGTPAVLKPAVPPVIIPPTEQSPSTCQLDTTVIPLAMSLQWA